jgi:hypothetical protein
MSEHADVLDEDFGRDLVEVRAPLNDPVSTDDPWRR